MSAFICSDYHLSYIVQAGVNFKAWVNMGAGFNYLEDDKTQHVFEVLKRENIRSVNRRYEENTSARQLGQHRLIINVLPVAALKAIACLEYQSCEHDEWESSQAKAILGSIKEACIRALPGYESAAWEISEPAGYVEPISLMAMIRKQKGGGS